ncbi:antitoxin VbhA family protein [uncultured Actinobacillus sp.]|uniref:antitoxin VbhA family protein n=1 Tax=uncultured Actinobacillus sp. TaxID=417616 RepID=UPI0025CFEDD8|nr:antitoxin VbhA family protein [uncultured Actinobacillus sp.]
MRKDAVQFALDNNRLEGMQVDDEAIDIFNQWADGVISFKDVEEGIYELCGIR